MTTLDAIIVGTVQGLTEFLPVSSSGHLVIVRYFYGVQDMTLSYSVMLHGGTLLAVIVALWREILDCAKLLLAGTRTGMTILLALIVATIPGALIGYLFASKLDTLFVEKGLIWHGVQLEPYKFVGAAMLVTAQAFLHKANEMLKNHGDALDHGPWYNAITLKRAVWIGLAQAVAVVPGISRSGATIATGIMAGLSRATAARFSFLMAIPIVLGAVIHDLIDHRVELMYESTADLHVQCIGVAVAAVTGFIAVRFMLRWLQTHDLHDFVVYLWIVGLICIAS